ncbi:MAG: DUF4387 family protein [Oscillospiraceae bacterium]|nr:DUF4387 family protein [Oscillospiraceae bacterium]MBQ6901425.1 DUF4387 family protein [Oscillospiraceae bacterium]
MKKLIDYTKILRSKNAGPLYITFDLIFETCEEMQYVAERLTKEAVSKAYDVDESKIDIIIYAVVDSIKITFPRKNISGALSDNDIYGCQQHIPLANIEI